MKHPDKIYLAEELARQRKELRQEAFDRILELVKANNNCINLKYPYFKNCHGDDLISIQYGTFKRWLAAGNSEPCLFAVWDKHGAGGIVPLPSKGALIYELDFRTPKGAWKLVELIEDTLNI